MTEWNDLIHYFEKYDDEINDRVTRDIEKNRKGNLRLRVTDRAGNPVSGVKVHFSQTGHDFRFGANLFMLDELESETKNEAYKSLFANLFNTATLPFYWNSTEPERLKTRYDADSPKLYRRPPIDLCLRFCEDNGIEPREHALAYHGFFPEWLRNADKETVKRELIRRFREIGERYGNRIPTMEVTNEMFWKKSVTDFYFDEEYLPFCFSEADKAMPHNRLGINEATSFVWKSKDGESSPYGKCIRKVLDAGGRIDLIGMQYHLFFKREIGYESFSQYLNPDALFGSMDALYNTFKRDLEVTEVTIPAYSQSAEDEKLQAFLLSKLYPIWFSHEAMDKIIYWNLVDGYAYGAKMGEMSAGENYFHGGLVRFDLTPKPSYMLLHDLFNKTYHTEETTETDADGVATIRGFYGTYCIRFERGGHVLTENRNYTKSAATEQAVLF